MHVPSGTPSTFAGGAEVGLTPRSGPRCKEEQRRDEADSDRDDCDRLPDVRLARFAFAVDRSALRTHVAVPAEFAQA